MKVTIAARLWMMVVCSVVALLAVGISGAWVAGTMGGTINKMMDDTMPSIDTIAEMQGAFMTLRTEAVSHMATKEPSIKESATKSVETNVKLLEGLFATYDQLITDDKDRQLLEAEKQLFKDYQVPLKEMLEYSRNYDADASGRILTQKVRPIGEKLSDTFKAHVAYNRDAIAQLRAHNDRNAVIGKTITWVAILGGAGFVAVLGFLLVRSLTRNPQSHAGHPDPYRQ